MEADNIMRRINIRDEMRDDALGNLFFLYHPHSSNPPPPLLLEKHTQYWSQYPGNYDHSRFSSGFITGWNDAYEFIQLTPIGSATISDIGFKGTWAMKRTSDHDKSYWEFEHGFMQGVACAVDDFKVLWT